MSTVDTEMYSKKRHFHPKIIKKEHTHNYNIAQPHGTKFNFKLIYYKSNILP